MSQMNPPTFRIAETPVQVKAGIEITTWVFSARFGWYGIISPAEVCEDDTHWCHSATRPTHDPRENGAGGADPLQPTRDFHEWLTSLGLKTVRLDEADWQRVAAGLADELRAVIEDIEDPEHNAQDWSQHVVVRNARAKLAAYEAARMGEGQ